MRLIRSAAALATYASMFAVIPAALALIFAPLLPTTAADALLVLTSSLLVFALSVLAGSLADDALVRRAEAARAPAGLRAVREP